MARSQKAVTVKLPSDLYQQAADLVSLTELTFRELVARALERELRDQIRCREDGGIQKALDEMRAYRERSTVTP